MRRIVVSRGSIEFIHIREISSTYFQFFKKPWIRYASTIIRMFERAKKHKKQTAQDYNLLDISIFPLGFILDFEYKEYEKYAFEKYVVYYDDIKVDYASFLIEPYENRKHIPITYKNLLEIVNIRKIFANVSDLNKSPLPFVNIATVLKASLEAGKEFVQKNYYGDIIELRKTFRKLVVDYFFKYYHNFDFIKNDYLDDYTEISNAFDKGVLKDVNFFVITTTDEEGEPLLIYYIFHREPIIKRPLIRLYSVVVGHSKIEFTEEGVKAPTIYRISAYRSFELNKISIKNIYKGVILPSPSFNFAGYMGTFIKDYLSFLSEKRSGYGFLSEGLLLRYGKLYDINKDLKNIVFRIDNLLIKRLSKFHYSLNDDAYFTLNEDYNKFLNPVADENLTNIKIIPKEGLLVKEYIDNKYNLEKLFPSRIKIKMPILKFLKDYAKIILVFPMGKIYNDAIELKGKMIPITYAEDYMFVIPDYEWREIKNMSILKNVGGIYVTTAASDKVWEVDPFFYYFMFGLAMHDVDINIIEDSDKDYWKSIIDHAFKMAKEINKTLFLHKISKDIFVEDFVKNIHKTPIDKEIIDFMEKIHLGFVQIDDKSILDEEEIYFNVAASIRYPRKKGTGIVFNFHLMRDVKKIFDKDFVDYSVALYSKPHGFFYIMNKQPLARNSLSKIPLVEESLILDT